MKALTLGLLALLLVGCGGSSEVLNTNKLENGIRHQYDKQGVSVKVTCPSDVEIEAGRTFHCLVNDDNSSDTVRMTVTIENDDGYVTWNTEG